ncbi:alanine-synthesizing transaminase [Catalinimonas alkaloidigena]|uniref:alanine transaminase n=1 Tax=Catalinimonas alkaloidigena TaxID=1075417 RepID=A0A1G9UBU6_9BACT|nr:pyridoxal phosphate-dependent aminotransferase [Catalinimonas alkaloidigena]SDM57194.1 alanine-synthesizing transaminase [Catalinimonas alkaloidigena]
MIRKSSKLNQVNYEIRGPIFEKARELEEAGHNITRLNIGNPAPFGFTTPTELVNEIVQNLVHAQGYIDTRGLPAAREAIRRYSAMKGITDVRMEDIYVGNGVSELIMFTMQALLNDGDEVLIPSPDYPLWTSAVNLAGGRAVHYRCDEASDWMPDLADLESKISHRTKALVVINPNNPTGAVYSEELLQKMAKIAERHRLVLYSDEIYDQILYDDTVHHSIASYVKETLCVTMNGLSKNSRAAGFRAGWAVVSGRRAEAKSYLEGLTTLASMRLCSNVPTQFAITVALDSPSSIRQMTLPQGRLRQQRDLCIEKLNQIEGISCVMPRGAFYAFPKIDLKRFRVENDQQFILDILQETRILLVQGTGFNWPEPDHFRVVFLPPVETLGPALDRLGSFLASYRGTQITELQRA